MTESGVFAFLLIALVAGVLLMAVVAGPKNHRRGNRRAGRGSGIHGPGMTIEQMRERWSVIESMAAGGGNGLRQAVSEADKLLDQALRHAGARGETLGERLKSAKPQFSTYARYDATWRAHKLRNALAHEVGFDLVPSQAREAINDFHIAIRELGGL